MNNQYSLPVRMVTAAALFDGHDAAINIMRRVLQSKGVEIIHLGHNRSVHEIVEAAIEEDVHGIAITSYQGGHMEFFKYMKDLLVAAGCGHIQIFGGGGGTILPEEIEALHRYGIARIYSPDDGRRMGLEGMIEEVISKIGLPPAPSGEGEAGGQADYWRAAEKWGGALPLGEWKDIRRIARAITLAENGMDYRGILKGDEEGNDPAKNPSCSVTVDQFPADPMLYAKLKDFALAHSKKPTMAEEVLWEQLRDERTGCKFRRQHIIDQFIADFACLKKGLLIEIDGNHHQLPEVKVSEEERTKILNELGFVILRFTNDEVLSQLNKVLQQIHHHLQSIPNKKAEKKPVPHNHTARHSTGGSRGEAVLGITGTGGAGKSSLTDELVRRFLHAFPQRTVAVISVDPSRKKTGGALLGDRIRMNAISSPRAYMRSLATRASEGALSPVVQEAIDICKEAGFDLVILESAGTGQGDASIPDHCDVSLFVMTPEYGAASQLEKINMLDYADLVAINKCDKAGALDALHDVRKQYKRNHGLWTAKDDELPVVGTIAAQFNDAGVNELFQKLVQTFREKTGMDFGKIESVAHVPEVPAALIIPPKRSRYLSEISEGIRQYDQWVKEQCGVASHLYQVASVQAMEGWSEAVQQELKEKTEGLRGQLHPDCQKLIDQWPVLQQKYAADFLEYGVRGQVIRQPLAFQSLSGSRIRRIVLPIYSDWGDILRWQLQENLPGHFPFTAGVFELKRQDEDPTRMFAGEGTPERTNKRFHYVSQGQPARRLSTAFDSVTLYGENPDCRPDIYGKVGNSGVSVATVDDAKKLYSGFDLCDPRTSVSMTINGPAPVVLAFFLNAAIDQQCEKWIEANGLWAQVEAAFQKRYAHLPRPVYFNPLSPGSHPVAGHEHSAHPLPDDGKAVLGLGLLGLSGEEVLPAEVYRKIKAETLSQVRGTVQADILKEDQAQNTCIFSTEFALKLMGDVQAYFIENRVRNFYSVSISGYHIAEAGANPITQLAFTLANGFTYVEYYLSRGMRLDDFAPNLSFFFSNGMDPEYSVIGRVARRIWARAMKLLYKGSDRSQKLKYHIQTSGRSLHAQEIDFNDIRTTLQALYAIYDNCNSLHTNAYDEAITTPTEESVRRAMAIQLIINRELGTAKTENFIQGSFAIEELTNLVEEAVLAEFDRISDRGGVLGAMERMYQRNKIQEESLEYEHRKHTGALPLIGVNSFLNKKGSPTILPREVIRSTVEEKEQQVRNLQAFQERNRDRSEAELIKLKAVAVGNGNLFGQLMETVKYCSLGQVTHALYEVGGQYRRNM